MMEEKLIENFLTYYFFNLEQNEPGNNKKKFQMLFEQNVASNVT